MWVVRALVGGISYWSIGKTPMLVPLQFICFHIKFWACILRNEIVCTTLPIRKYILEHLSVID